LKGVFLFLVARLAMNRRGKPTTQTLGSQYHSDEPPPPMAKMAMISARTNKGKLRRHNVESFPPTIKNKMNRKTVMFIA